MGPNLKSENSLLDSQMEQLLKEMSTILNENWKSLNSKGYVCIKSMFEKYSDVLNDLGDENTAEKKIENENEGNLKYAHLKVLDECNEHQEKLNEIIKYFQSHVERVKKLRKNMNSLLTTKLDLFEIISAESFAILIERLCDCYEREFHLKSKVVNELLFKSRTNREYQVFVVSVWIHEPFIDESLLLKLNKLFKV